MRYSNTLYAMMHENLCLIRRSAAIVIICLVSVFSLMAQSSGTADCPMQKMELKRLPDLNVPRVSHVVFSANGELVVVGGHTTGFVPTATAEYLKDGKWHLMESAYEHDNGFGVMLKSGKLLIIGGHEKSLGIGQTYPAELYDPETHSFEGFGCLDTKRSLAQVMLLDSGNVVIAGNWYAKDAIEVFDGKQSFSHVKTIGKGFVRPYIFQTSPYNVVIFGSQDTYGKARDNNTAYLLRGDSIDVPLFSEWHPVMLFNRPSDSVSFVGDKKKGVYAYLFLVTNDEGQIAIARMESDGQGDPRFSLLPTTHRFPMKGVNGQEIMYFGSVLVNQNTDKGYMIGCDKDGRLYALCINNVRAKENVSLTLYYSEPQENVGHTEPLLTPEGNIVVTGGIGDSNFRPFSSVYMLCLGSNDAEFCSSMGLLPWILAVVFLIIVALLCLFLFRKRRKSHIEEERQTIDDTVEKQLMDRICQMMEQEKLFLNSDLKLSDVSAVLSTNSRYVSETIRNQRQTSFTQFVNGYRVEHAKKLMKENTDRKIAEIATLSGFSGESSFFRTFKSFTGVTPKEWIAQNV